MRDPTIPLCFGFHNARLIMATILAAWIWQDTNLTSARLGAASELSTTPYFYRSTHSDFDPCFLQCFAAAMQAAHDGGQWHAQRKYRPLKVTGQRQI